MRVLVERSSARIPVSQSLYVLSLSACQSCVCFCVVLCCQCTFTFSAILIWCDHNFCPSIHLAYRVSALVWLFVFLSGTFSAIIHPFRLVSYAFPTYALWVVFVTHIFGQLLITAQLPLLTLDAEHLVTWVVPSPFALTLLFLECVNVQVVAILRLSYTLTKGL